MKKSDWDRFWDSAEGGAFTRISWSKRRMEQLLSPYLLPGSRVLDAGCGSGYFSALFLSRGCRVSTLDASTEALEIARIATCGKADEYLQEDLLDGAFGRRHREKFDLVFTDGLFEHFVSPDQKRIMNNLVSTLKPDGVIATFVPNALSWWTLARPLFMRGIYEKPFRRAELRDLHSALSLIGEGGLSVLPFRMSPERILGARFGMLLYHLGRKETCRS